MEYLHDIRKFISELIADALGSGQFIDGEALSDAAAREAHYLRPDHDQSFVTGSGFVELRDADGKVKHLAVFRNKVTEVGDQMYGERGANIGTPPAYPTGMRLGTGGETAASKTGAGAAIVTYISGSQEAHDASFPTSSLSSGLRRIQYKCTWDAGDVTQNGIDEWVVTNETPITDVAGNAANTVSRAVDTSSPVNKGSGDSLAITWNHDLGTL